MGLTQSILHLKGFRKMASHKYDALTIPHYEFENVIFGDDTELAALFVGFIHY